ncbi:MAG: tRNA-binding protein [Saprospiraceae bacterium]
MDQPQSLAEIQFTDFLKVGMYAGTIIAVRLNPKAKQPAYILKIDFGDLGVKRSSAQLVENYTSEDLLATQVIAVLNFPMKRVAGIKSEVLVLATVCEKEGTILLRPSRGVTNGARVG